MIHFKKRGASDGYSQIEGIPKLISDIMQIRGISTKEAADAFLHPSLDDLHDPYSMHDMEKAVKIIRNAIKEGKKITVYGDYDVDGVCATSIMMETLEELSANVNFRIPSRHDEGYGLNLNAIREMRNDGTQLLITVDCGVTNLAESLLARQLGMQVIVTDHHQLGDDLPQADAVLNPLLGDYPFPRLCGAGVALKVTQALLGMEGVKRRIDLAALATVADVVPLVDENRVIVKYGMEKIDMEYPCHSARKGISELIRVSGVKLPLNTGKIGFQLAPRINAGGRMEDAMQCVTMLTTKDEDEARSIAEHLNDENTARKDIESQIISEAEEMIPQSVDFYTDKAIIIVGKKWNTGIVGLAAGKICEKYHFPTIVVSDNDGIAVGSCRSIPGVNIFKALSGCADLFSRFGGHEMAAGLTMQTKDIPVLRVRLNKEISKICENEKCYIPVAEYDAETELRNISAELIEKLELVAPTGQGNPNPAFILRNANVNMRRIGADGKHLRIQARDNGRIMDGVAFSMGYLADEEIDCADMVFTPEFNEFRGQRNPQLNISCIVQSATDSRLPEKKVFFQRLLQEIDWLAANKNRMHTSDVRTKKIGVKSAHNTICGGIGRGNLLVAHTIEAAAQFTNDCDKDGHSMVNLQTEGVPDPRGFNTLMISPENGVLQDVWHKILLLDEPLPGEIAMIAQACPRAEICTVECAKTKMADKIKQWTPTIEELRAVYVAISKGNFMEIDQISQKLVDADMPLSEEKLWISLTALCQTELIDMCPAPFRLVLLPKKKCNPMETPIMQYLLLL